MDGRHGQALDECEPTPRFDTIEDEPTLALRSQGADHRGEEEKMAMPDERSDRTLPRRNSGTGGEGQAVPGECRPARARGSASRHLFRPIPEHQYLSRAGNAVVEDVGQVPVEAFDSAQRMEHAREQKQRPARSVRGHERGDRLSSSGPRTDGAPPRLRISRLQTRLRAGSRAPRARSTLPAGRWT